MIHAPKAAWLKKMTMIMGRSRWQSRYFVLLETELRYYKDEYAVTPNNIWSLRDVDQIKQVTMAGQLYCLSLEPTIDCKNKKKSLVLCFQSAFEMHDWQEQMASRLIRLTPSKPAITSTSSISLNRRRGVILSSIEISEGTSNWLLSPNLMPPCTPAESILSSASSISSISTLNQCYSTLPSPPHTLKINGATSSKNERSGSDDPSDSPTFLQYKSQFHL